MPLGVEHGRDILADMPGAAATSFSIAGMYLARALADEILLTNNHLSAGLGVFALGATASVAQMTRRALRAARDPAADRSPWRAGWR